MSTLQWPTALQPVETTLVNEPRNTPLVELRSVSKSFPGPHQPIQALRDVNLDLRAGELLSIVGPPKAGKSTLLNIIAGLQKPTDGCAICDGAPIAEKGPDRALLSQHSSVQPWRTVYQNLNEAIERSQRLTAWERQTLINELLDRAGLTLYQHKTPQQLSSGLRQRVAIARAFAAQPRVLLVDNLFAALDSATRGTLQELLRNWRRVTQIETVVLVTHDIDEAIYLSDRIAVLGRGPGTTVREVLQVPLARPRNRSELIQTVAWAQLKERLTTLLAAN